MISLIKSPSSITISPLIDNIGFKEVTTFTIKSELPISLKNTKLFIIYLYISIINLFFIE